MMRKCDGTDPNLIMYIDEAGNRVPARAETPVQTVPCDCGKRFDDVKYIVIWPHQEV